MMNRMFGRLDVDWLKARASGQRQTEIRESKIFIIGILRKLPPEATLNYPFSIAWAKLDAATSPAVSQRYSDLGVGQERDVFPDNRPAS
jgi:hypothetical protein